MNANIASATTLKPQCSMSQAAGTLQDNSEYGNTGDRDARKLNYQPFLDQLQGS